MTEKKSCASCAFCVEDEYGYSEYTILGAVYTCMGNLNPKFPLDDADDKGDALDFADTCPAFLNGVRLNTGLRVDDPQQEFTDWAKQFRAGDEQS